MATGMIRTTACLLLSAFALNSCASITPEASDDDESLASTTQALAPIDDPKDPGDDDGGGGGEPPPPVASVTEVIQSFNGFDIDGDGTQEIESTSFLVGDQNIPNATKGIALVLYEPRVFDDTPGMGTSGAEMRLWLQLLRSDMVAEGWNARFVQTKVYRGPEDQDGRTVLALRRMLKAINAHHPLRTVLLIGDYPSSSIVRQVLTRPHVGPEGKTFGGVNFANTDYIATGTELIATRSDIVLSDLNGNWENLYYKEPTTFHDVQFVPVTPPSSWPAAGQTLSSTFFNVIDQPVRDYFLVKDRAVTVILDPGQARVQVNDVAEPGPELFSTDRYQPNPIARPEISVSRLNARHVATKPVFSDNTTMSALGPDGKPARWDNVPSSRKVKFVEDPALERELLAKYFARNHAFRLGNTPHVHRTSAVRQMGSNLESPSSLTDMLDKADPDFGTPVETEADLAEYVRWLKKPADLRAIASHSNQTYSQFTASPASTMETLVGGKPWLWQNLANPDGTRSLVPTYQGVDQADFRLYRTLYENNVLQTAGEAFYVHMGCSVSGYTQEWEDDAYSAPQFAANNNAEAIMFLGNAMGLAARAKVFYDSPDGFAEAIFAKEGRFSAGLAGYFADNAADGSLNPEGTSNWQTKRTRTLARKQTYFWSLFGDPTLNIHYD